MAHFSTETLSEGNPGSATQKKKNAAGKLGADHRCRTPPGAAGPHGSDGQCSGRAGAEGADRHVTAHVGDPVQVGGAPGAPGPRGLPAEEGPPMGQQTVPPALPRCREAEKRYCRIKQTRGRVMIGGIGLQNGRHFFFSFKHISRERHVRCPFEGRRCGPLGWVLPPPTTPLSHLF